MSDNFNEKIFKTTSKILDDHTEIVWNSPICAFVVERRLIEGGDGRWEAIGWIPENRRSFSMGNSSENSKFEYRVVAKLNNEIMLASQATGIPPLVEKSEAKTVKGERPVKKKKAPAFVPPIAPTPPGPPQGPVNFEWTSPGVFKVSWNPPSNDGGSPITSYIIEKANQIGKTWSQVDEVPSDSTTAFVALKKRINKQRFAITVVNACGHSTPLITEKLRPLPPPAPEVEIDSSNQNYIELKWTFPDRPQSENAKVKFCYIRRRVGWRDRKFEKIRNNMTYDSYRDLDVVPRQTYQYEVLVIGSAGVVARTTTKRIAFQTRTKRAKKLRKKLRKQLEMDQEKASIQEDPMQSIDQMDEAGPSGFKQEVQEQQELASVKQEVGESEMEPDMKVIKLEINLD